MKAAKNTRIFYKDAVDIYSNLTPEDCQRLLIAHLSYNIGEPIEKYFQKGDPLIGTFVQIKRMIDINETKYQETCQKRAESGRKAAEAKWKNKPVEEHKEENINNDNKEEDMGYFYGKVVNGNLVKEEPAIEVRGGANIIEDKNNIVPENLLKVCREIFSGREYLYTQTDLFSLVLMNNPSIRKLAAEHNISEECLEDAWKEIRKEYI